jgi:hypothetical protein
MSVQAEDPVSEERVIPGELIYEYTPVSTQVVDYGVSAEGVLSGQTPPPAEGARFDVYFEGPVAGKLRGTVKGGRRGKGRNPDQGIRRLTDALRPHGSVQRLATQPEPDQLWVSEWPSAG